MGSIFCNCYKIESVFKNWRGIIFSVKNRPDILQLLQKIDLIFCCQKSTQYFQSCTKIERYLLSKNWLDIFKVVQKSTRYFASKNRVGFLVENRPVKSMHNFETNGAPYVAGYIAATENCCVPMVVVHMLFTTRIVSLLLGASFNTIFSMHVTSLLLGASSIQSCSYRTSYLSTIANTWDCTS